MLGENLLQGTGGGYRHGATRIGNIAQSLHGLFRPVQRLELVPQGRNPRQASDLVARYRLDNVAGQELDDACAH